MEQNNLVNNNEGNNMVNNNDNNAPGITNTPITSGENKSEYKVEQIEKGDPLDYDNDTWTIIKSYFDINRNYLTKHHIESYNDFILNKIPQTFSQYNPQIIFKEYSEELKKYKYTLNIYYGGKTGTEIFIGKPIIYSNHEGKEVKKQMYPNEARLRNLTYASHIFCNIEVDYEILDENGEPRTTTRKFENVNLGKIPVMLDSCLCALSGADFNLRKEMGECPYDQGGYFVVEGAEKVIVSHERKAENKLYIVKSQDTSYCLAAQIKSVPNDSFKYARTTVVNMHAESDIFTVRLPSIPHQIPLFVLFRALGIESDKEILEYILYELDSEKAKLYMDKLLPTIENAWNIFTQNEAINYLASLTNGNTASHLMTILETDVFPHVGDSFIHKAYYLGHAVHKILNVYFKIDQETDRDSFMFKRVDLSGFLLASLFRESFKQFQRDTKIAIDTEYRFNASKYIDDRFTNVINEENLRNVFNYASIEGMFMKSFKIGTILNKKGLIQALNRLSSPGTISHLRRINTIGDNIMIGQRKLHGTQYGIICPVETPDGGNIGIKKHLTSLGHITFGCSPEPIIKLLYELGVVSLDNLFPKMIDRKTKVFVNGKWIGIIADPKALVYSLKLYRQNGLINIFTSIAWSISKCEVSLLTGGGRPCRPLYILENNELLIHKGHLEGINDKTIVWNNLIGGLNNKNATDLYNCDYSCPPFKQPEKKDRDFDLDLEVLKEARATIEYIDTDESDTIMLKTNINEKDDGEHYSHCEIHSSLIMGFIGFTIPFVNTSQAPRNVYGTGQTKQSVGMYVSNYKNRFDTSAHVLNYPQRPLVGTRMSNYTFSNQLPTGMNAIVAIASYSGYNQDDSVILNKSALERGVFRSAYFKTYQSKEMTDTRSDTVEFFFDPKTDDTINSEVKKNALYNYQKTDEHGVAKEGSYVYDNDVLITTYTKTGQGANTKYFDNSEVVKQDGYGVVDKVFSDSYNSNGEQICKVRICTTREPTLGDKFASRHGQKGVCGMILREEDMPFTKEGIRPDIIINPHAIPSRMTLGQLVECVTGKLCCHFGCFNDATPFTNTHNEDLYDIIEEHCGYSRHGDEVLYSGFNGKQMSTKIFIGPTYYMRLKHMVKDKVNSRGEGKVTLKTRQPPSGKSAGGGLRIGEMERDAVLSHGALHFLKETMMERSDKHEVYISENSGLTGIVNHTHRKYICPSTSGPLEFKGDYLDELHLLNDNSNVDIVKAAIPYNTALLSHEAQAIGITMRLIPKPDANYSSIRLDNEAFIPQDLLTRKSKGPTQKKKLKVTIKVNERNNTKYESKLKGNKILITNLSNRISEEDIKTICEKCGQVYKVLYAPTYGSAEATIIFTTPEAAQKAVDKLHKRILDEREIYVELSDNDTRYGYGNGNGNGNGNGYGNGYGKPQPQQPTTPPPFQPRTPPPEEIVSSEYNPYSQDYPEYKQTLPSKTQKKINIDDFLEAERKRREEFLKEDIGEYPGTSPSYLPGSPTYAPPESPTYAPPPIGTESPKYVPESPEEPATSGSTTGKPDPNFEQPTIECVQKLDKEQEYSTFQNNSPQQIAKVRASPESKQSGGFNVLEMDSSSELDLPEINIEPENNIDVNLESDIDLEMDLNQISL